MVFCCTHAACNQFDTNGDNNMTWSQSWPATSCLKKNLSAETVDRVEILVFCAIDLRGSAGYQEKLGNLNTITDYIFSQK